MIKSMTGFGRGEAKDLQRQFIVEIKSVNHRYNDIVVRMPKRLTYLEEDLKKCIKQSIKRGRVEVYVTVENIDQMDSQISINEPLAKQYVDNLKMLQQQCNIIDDISVSLVAKFPDVIKIESKEDDEEAVWKCLKEALDLSLKMLMNMRKVEGEKLAEDIQQRCVHIEKKVCCIEKRGPQVVLEYKDKLKERLHEILDENVQIDENRMHVEIALIADKSNITEEIVRLKSHVDQLRQALKINEPVGRKLDFLIQEMNREINTVGSKSNDLQIINDVVDIKSELEKIREQIQNIE